MFNFYPLLRALLFTLPPETAHHLTLNALATLDQIGKRKNFQTKTNDPITLMGIEFPNRIGLAAGLDKTGAHIDPLRRLGFGFIEIGTITPRPQAGNPKPRLFRLPNNQALLNRMGFNNPGIDACIRNVRKAQYPGVIGINIGKNLDTPLDRAVEDYLIGFNVAYAHADYITVNISSPNTPGLRDLQHVESLKPLLDSLKQAQQINQQQLGRYVPLVVKVAPDLEGSEIDAMSEVFKTYAIDGLIATNTTQTDQGGLSGAPLRDRSPKIVQQFRQALGSKFPIIGVGGIVSGADAVNMLDAGADLCQLYSGLIYRGPALIRECIDAIAASRTESQGSPVFADQTAS